MPETMRPWPDDRNVAIAQAVIARVLGPLLTTGQIRVWLFGSRARGDALPRSDLDLAFEGELPVGLLARVREALEESRVLCGVDLVDLRNADPGLRQVVLREGLPCPA